LLEQRSPFLAYGTSAEQQAEKARRRTELAIRLQQVQEAKERALAEESQLSEELQTLPSEAPSAEVVRSVSAEPSPDPFYEETGGGLQLDQYCLEQESEGHPSPNLDDPESEICFFPEDWEVEDEPVNPSPDDHIYDFTSFQQEITSFLSVNSCQLEVIGQETLSSIFHGLRSSLTQAAALACVENLTHREPPAAIPIGSSDEESLSNTNRGRDSSYRHSKRSRHDRRRSRSKPRRPLV